MISVLQAFSGFRIDDGTHNIPTGVYISDLYASKMRKIFAANSNLPTWTASLSVEVTFGLSLNRTPLAVTGRWRRLYRGLTGRLSLSSLSLLSESSSWVISADMSFYSSGASGGECCGILGSLSCMTVDTAVLLLE